MQPKTKHKNPNFEPKGKVKNYVRIWVSLLKSKGIYIKMRLVTFETWWMKYSKYFSLKMNREKSIFHFEKQNFELIRYSVHTIEYLAFRKGLLAGLCLKLKVYVTKLLSVYIIYKISHGLKKVYDSVRIFIFLRIPLTLKTCLYWILN